jgi:hypothetical protein
MPSGKQGTDQRKDANLYKRYVRSTQDALRGMLALLPDRRCHADFLEMNGVMSAEEFAKCLDEMANDPERRRQLEKALNRPKRHSPLETGTV